MMHVCVCVCMCVCVVHLHCSAQLSMFDMEKCYRNKIMEKRYRNKIIIIIIITQVIVVSERLLLHCSPCRTLSPRWPSG